MPIFWLDANVFIEAKDRYYPFARVPQFWSFLSGKIGEGSICCPKNVYDELIAYGDDLSRWVKARKKRGLCIQPNKGIQNDFRRVADHVDTTYPRHRSQEFLSGADPWVIASAMHGGGT